MPREIADEINANRQQIGRALAGDRIATPSQSIDLTLSPIPVSVSATVDIYTRPVNDTALVGHPDDGNGWGRGRVGDYRGDWTQQESVTGEVTRDGRQAIADALVTGTPRLSGSAAGLGVVDAFGLDDSTTTTRSRASFLFNQSPDTVSSVDVRTSDGRVVAEGSLSGVAAGSQTEVRVDVTLSFADASRSASETVRVDVIADALRTRKRETITLAAAAFVADTGTSTVPVRKNAATQARGASAVAESVLFRSEPNDQPADIILFGVLDNNGDVVTGTEFSPQEKTDRLRIRAKSGVVIR